MMPQDTTDTTRGRTLSAALCAAAVLLLTSTPACSNSILGNAIEAGAETLLDTPVPTPTRGS